MLVSSKSDKMRKSYPKDFGFEKLMVFTTMNIDQLNLAVLVGEKYRKIKAKYLLKIAEPSPKNYISRQKLQNILQPYQAFLPINAKMSKLQCTCKFSDIMM